jgi:acetyl esterase/lipase
MNQEPFVIPLWPMGASGSEGWNLPEVMRAAAEPISVPIVRNIVQPTLAVYLPDAAIATGTAMVVAPGGAFHFLAIEHEGTQVAEWLVARGVAAIILRYRVIQTPVDDAGFLAQMGATMADRNQMIALQKIFTPLISADGQQAIRLVRQHAAEWGLEPQRIGIVGFSAGGYLATCVATQYDQASRPDFAAPIYAAPLEGYSVPADAPPLFLLCASDDQMAVNASIPLFQAWLAAGKVAELHSYAQGGHGFGMLQKNLPSDNWMDVFLAWVKAQGMLGERAS